MLSANIMQSFAMTMRHSVLATYADLSLLCGGPPEDANQRAARKGARPVTSF
jgi:hypothetical protein